MLFFKTKARAGKFTHGKICFGIFLKNKKEKKTAGIFTHCTIFFDIFSYTFFSYTFFSYTFFLLEHNGVLLEHNGVLLEHNGVLLEQNAGWDRQKYEEKVGFCMNWVLVNPNRL